MLSSAHANLRRLVLARLVVLAGVLGVLGWVWLQLQAPLAYGWLGGTAVVGVALSLLTLWRLRQPWPVAESEFLAQLVLEVIALSVLLYWSGGATNPFVSYFLVPLSMAAALLSGRATAVVALLAVALYTLLLFFHEPLPAAFSLEPAHSGHPHSESVFTAHVVGMWFNFALSAALITYVVVRMAATLREQREQLNRQREQALHNEQLLAVATLAAGTAHELGTPLNTMTVLLEEMRDGPVTAGDVALLQTQVTQCRNILRDLVRTAETQQHSNPPPLVAADFVARALARWQLLRPVAAHRLVIAGSGTPPALPADDALQQAVINLLNNAADTKSGAVEVTLDWSDTAVELRIRDHGPGIDLALADRLGQPFVTSKRGGGLGLGLFLSHATIERCGGTIQLLNHPDGGTEALLVLPTASGPG